MTMRNTTSIEFHSVDECWNRSRPILSEGRIYVLAGRGHSVYRKLSVFYDQHQDCFYPAGKFWVASRTKAFREGDLVDIVSCVCYKYSIARGLLVLRDLEFRISKDELWLKSKGNEKAWHQLPTLLYRELAKYEF